MHGVYVKIISEQTLSSAVLVANCVNKGQHKYISEGIFTPVTCPVKQHATKTHGEMEA